jgi:hypothetical protein
MGHLVNFGQSSGPVDPFAPSLLALGSLSVTRPILFHYISNRVRLLHYANLLFDALSSNIIRIQSISEYNTLRGIKTLHPLASVYDSSTAKFLPAGNYSFSFYSIFLKDLKCGELKYGRNYYDYQEGTLVFISPGQVIGVPETPEGTTGKGWVLLFHPELLKGTALGKNMDNYRFFSYSVNEALHISENEREIVIDQMKKIQMEMEHSVDKHSKIIITASIELLLTYFSRFYDRQFFTRENEVKGTRMPDYAKVS